jgi:hypothetical protein
LYVLAGVNGASKSSIGGAMFRAAGADYYNPDEAARKLIAANLGLDQTTANAAAWRHGRRLLERATDERLVLRARNHTRWKHGDPAACRGGVRRH